MFNQHESERHELPAELAAFEVRLREVSPAAPCVERDRLMFAAGRAAVLAGQDGQVNAAGPSWSGVRFWRAAAGMATAASLLLAVLLVWEKRGPAMVAADEQAAKPPAAVVVEHEAVEPPEVVPAYSRRTLPLAGSATRGYLGARHIALTYGVGALPPEPRWTNGDVPIGEIRPPTTARDLLEELLPEATRSSASRS